MGLITIRTSGTLTVNGVKIPLRQEVFEDVIDIQEDVLDSSINFNVHYEFPGSPNMTRLLKKKVEEGV